ncbi:UNVERIFIED_CONTAM: hypothetical protein FKN15_022758 [Acipenser sinensis]
MPNRKSFNPCRFRHAIPRQSHLCGEEPAFTWTLTLARPGSLLDNQTPVMGVLSTCFGISVCLLTCSEMAVVLALFGGCGYTSLKYHSADCQHVLFEANPTLHRGALAVRPGQRSPPSMLPHHSPGMPALILLVALLSLLLIGCDSQSAPRFTKVPVDQIGVSGGVASFVCQATGEPKPRVTWNKKGKKVNSQRIETIEFDEGAGAVLRIQPLRTPRDENIYECIGENSEGEVTVSAKLSILRVDYDKDILVVGMKTGESMKY